MYIGDRVGPVIWNWGSQNMDRT